MSTFVCKSLVFERSCINNEKALTQQTRHLCFVVTIPNSYTFTCFESDNRKNHVSSLAYLVHSLGLSPKALSASKLVTFSSSDEPNNKVIDFLKSYGFTQAQISTLVKKFPEILLLENGERMVFPKLKFLKAQGFSCREIAEMVSSFPGFMGRDLGTHIIPSFELFKDLFRSNEKVILAFKQCPDFLSRDIEKSAKPKIAILQELGVPSRNIATLFQNKPRLLILSLDRFRSIVEQVLEMGFEDSSKPSFVSAIHVVSSMSNSKWESKISAYVKWGFTEEEVLRVFERIPWCMQMSVEKITKGMNFFINEMGLSSRQVLDRPVLLNFSLEKRLVPRHLVFRALLSKGLVSKDVGLCALFESSESKFLQRFVTPYQKEAPELFELYHEKQEPFN